MRDVKRAKDKLQQDLDAMKEKYHNEKQKRIEHEGKIKELDLKCVELKGFADANA